MVIPLENVNLGLDIILIGASIWMVLAIRRLGGEIGKSLGIITAGGVVLGLAHIIETLTFAILHWENPVIEFSHRLIVLTGFSLLVLGFQRISRFK